MTSSHTHRFGRGWRKVLYIVTMTTVGYGDVSPQTPFGKTLAAMVMTVTPYIANTAADE